MRKLVRQAVGIQKDAHYRLQTLLVQGAHGPCTLAPCRRAAEVTGEGFDINEGHLREDAEAGLVLGEDGTSVEMLRSVSLFCRLRS